MPRPKKATVDYFPHYVANGKTISILESDFGNDGYALWFKILEILGNTEHHFIDCNMKLTWRFLLAKSRLEEKKVIEIIDLLAELDAIDKKLWQKKIIRSENFIGNLSTVYQRRGVNVLTKSEILQLLSTKNPLNGEHVNICRQSIVKESKGEKSIVKETPGGETETANQNQRDKIRDNAENLFSHYSNLAHTANHDKGTKTHEDIINKITSESGKHSLTRYLRTDEGYCKLVAILDRWHEYHRLVDCYELRTGPDSDYFFDNSFKKFLEKFTEFEDETTAQQKINYVKSKGERKDKKQEKEFDPFRHSSGKPPRER